MTLQDFTDQQHDRVQAAKNRRLERQQDLSAYREGQNAAGIVAQPVTAGAFRSGDPVLLNADGAIVEQEWTRSSPQRRIVAPRARVGEVLRFVILTYADRFEYWIGGDRVAPEKILTVDRQQEDIDREWPEKFGSGRDDWGLGLRTRVLGTNPILYRFRYLAGTGAQWSYDTILGSRFGYRGGGFWSINADRVAYSLILSPYAENYSNSLFVTRYRNYGTVPPGSIFSFVEWEVIAPQSAGGEEVTSRTQTRSISYNPSDLLIQAGYPAPAQSYNFYYLRRTYNEPVDNQIPSLGPVGGTYSTKQCSNPGDETLIATAFDSRYHTNDDQAITGTATSGLYSMALFDGQLSVSSGSRQESSSYFYNYEEHGPQNAPRGVYEACTGPWFNGNWTILRIDPPVALHPTVTRSSASNSSATLDSSVNVFITPALQIPFLERERTSSTLSTQSVSTKQYSTPSAIAHMPALRSYAYRLFEQNIEQQGSVTITSTTSNKIFAVADSIQGGSPRNFRFFPSPGDGPVLTIENNQFIQYTVDLYALSGDYGTEDVEILKSNEAVFSPGILELREDNTYQETRKILAMPLPGGWEDRRTVGALWHP